MSSSSSFSKDKFPSLTEKELKILDFLNSRTLARMREIGSWAGTDYNGTRAIMQTLLSNGLAKSVEPMGEKCFVITNLGSRKLEEAKSRLPGR